MKFNFKIIISCFLVLAVLVSGIVFLFMGIKDTININKITKNYLTTTGYFTDYEIYSHKTSRKGGTTYTLIYTYELEGKEYTVKTDYGVGYIPEKNSTREVKYNPDNYSEAVLSGSNSNSFLIFIGVFFTLGGVAFVIGALYIKGVFDKVKIDIMGAYFGIVFLIIGIGIILFQNGTTSSFMETIKYLGFWIFIPILFIAVGTFQTIKCLFINKKVK